MSAAPARRSIVLALTATLVFAVRFAFPQTPGPTVDELFDDSVLHGIRLTIHPKDWRELQSNFQLNTYYPCHFTWRGVTIWNVGIRSRGTGSRSGAKPGLRVDFDFYEKSKSFLGLKSVVLRNNTQDPSNLRERLSMLLFARMGVPASREAHTRLYVNSEYVGLYTLVESVDKVFLKKHFGENDGYLYKYDYDPEDLPYYFEDRGPDPSLYSPKPFQPETHEKDPDPEPIVAMIRAINETPDSDFLGVMASYLDLNTFMIHVAIENFLGDTDGILGDYGTNNFYFYRFERQTLSTFIPWDKSEAFTGGIEYHIWHNIDDVSSSARNRLIDRAVRFPELRDVYLDALLKCAELASSPDPSASDQAEGDSTDRPGWLEREALRGYEQIRDAALEDELKPFSNDEFEESIKQVLEFSRLRGVFVQQEVLRNRTP